MKFFVADKKGMTVWPCTCVDDMDPMERRLWPVFWARMIDRKLEPSMVRDADGP